MPVESILVIDDEALMRNFIQETLKRKGYQVRSVQSGEDALSLLEVHSFDLIISDIKMTGISGMDVLRQSKKMAPATLVILATAFGSVESAVEAMTLGAFNYVIKPFTPETIETLVQRASEHLDLLEENNSLRKQISETQSNVNFITNNSVMKKLLEQTKTIAKSTASVLITGESGVGKEVFAHLIHHYSGRSNEPFVKVNCAAVPDTLIESEFFGHEKGAYTGAIERRLGRFELANRGSLLLDEFTEVPPFLQAKLLRAIQEQEFERVGGSKAIEVDVRIIATSNRDLEEAIENGTLRKDLYYRLNVIPLSIPPLRERKEDIAPLATYFLDKFCLENGKKSKRFSEQALNILTEYDWPGNVRELANIVERSVVLSLEELIHEDVISIKKGNKQTASPTIFSGNITLAEAEKQVIAHTLKAHNNNRTQAAKVLDISPKTLRFKIEKYNLASKS